MVAALGGAALVTPSLAHATPAAHHAPAVPGTSRIASVQRQLGELAVRNTELVEQYDEARIEVAERRQQATAAALTAAQADAAFRGATADFTRIVQAQYESGGMTTGGALLDSDSGTNYLDRLDTMTLLSSHDADVVTLVRTTRATAHSASARAASLLASARSLSAGLDARQKSTAAQIVTYRALLSRLNSAQRAAYLRTQNPVAAVADTPAKAQKLAKSITTSSGTSSGKSADTASTDSSKIVATSAGAKAAIAFALKQVGKPYQWGSAGPDTFDCSGLTMMAWRQGGVSLPHSARAQYGYGHHVSRDELQPGDLVFFYQPIGHVALYIGNGLMVSAPTTGEDVTVVPLDAHSQFAGATRLT